VAWDTYRQNVNKWLIVGIVYTSYACAIVNNMDTLVSTLTTREARSQFSEVLGRVQFGDDRIGITRNGKLAAVVVSVGDLESLEQFEMAQDLAAYRAAKAEDDGQRVSLETLRSELAA